MKTNKEVLNICIEITFQNHHSFERFIELNQIRDCILIILSEYDYLDGELHLRVFGIIDDLSLLFINKNLDNFVDKVNNFRVRLIHLMCLEEPSTDNLNGEEGLGIKKSFRNEEWSYGKLECYSYNIHALSHILYLQLVKQSALSQFNEVIQTKSLQKH